VLGLVSALSTLAVAGGDVARWLSTPVYREPPVSQSENLFVVALIAVLALVEAALALRRSDTLRVLAMPAIAGVIFVAGISASVYFDKSATGCCLRARSVSWQQYSPPRSHRGVCSRPCSDSSRHFRWQPLSPWFSGSCADGGFRGAKAFHSLGFPSNPPS
jgi:hypothetical protein